MTDDTKQSMPLTVSSWSELWDFWTVKLATLASILGTIGVALPMLPADQTSVIPGYIATVCQLCGLLVTLGIIPARAVKQPVKLVK